MCETESRLSDIRIKYSSEPNHSVRIFLQPENSDSVRMDPKNCPTDILFSLHSLQSWRQSSRFMPAFDHRREEIGGGDKFYIRKSEIH